MKNVLKFFVGILASLGILTPIQTAKLKYLYKLHRWPNFEHPRDLNEKINWMKFYGDTSMWHIYADKFRVREYIESLGLKEILVPLIGKWDSVDEIDWEKLPNQFVVKCNNNSGDALICKDKKRLDINKTKKHFRKAIKQKLSIVSGEPHYAEIKPCIIAEEMLDTSTQPYASSSLVDYKIWTFNGKPEYIITTWNRTKHYANTAIFDTGWNFHPEWSVWTRHYISAGAQLPKPVCLNQMLEIASNIGKGIPVVRVDLYEVNGKVYFSEMTMTSQGGYMDFYSQDFLDIMGELTILQID